ncbi:MAG: hypothetical protein GX960_15220 [Actinomycetales bacterium]|nr:hypothetical protein [Actinomycetales bacterium]
MSQGYGPEHGQQGQWGQDGQNPPPAPQWGQPEQAPAPQPHWGQSSPASQGGSPMASPSQPQWGQASPAAAPGGYPGASYPGAPGAAGGSYPAPGASTPSMLSNIIKWMFFAVLAVVAVRLIGNVIVFGIGAAGGAAGSPEVVGMGSLFGLLVLLVNGVVSLAVLVLAVMVIVQASGRGRTGAIVVVAAMVLAVIAYWIVYGIYTVIIVNATDYSTVGVMSLVYLVVEIIRSLLVFAALIVGAMMSRRWAAQNA